MDPYLPCPVYEPPTCRSPSINNLVYHKISWGDKQAFSAWGVSLFIRSAEDPVGEPPSEVIQTLLNTLPM